MQVKNLSDKEIESFVIDLIKESVEKRVSDIHIQPEKTYAKIRMRIDGVLVDKLFLDLETYKKLLIKIKLLAGMDISEKRKPQDKGLKLEDFKDVDLRISSLATIDGEKIVIRILSLDQFRENTKLLGFSIDSKARLEKVISNKSGMVIFTGPTGSGKTTSLYYLLSQLNKEGVNIVTIEDPVEYNIDNINQISVNEKAGLTYANILRSVLRQDPDIIMIGEIRDRQTASIAIRAAITGHLVLTTLHCSNAIARLKDLGVEDYLINSAISLLASQRLVRKLCSCKIEGRMTDEEYNFIKAYIDVDREHKIYRPGSCEKCQGGFIGREAVEESILLDDDFRNIGRNYGLASEELRQKLEKDGFKSMLVHGLGKVLDGITTLDEVLKVVDL